eukprot:Phypoly_transcript_15467.p1 GENE.Phypoly_transcript_15467~~Phypoly_transcript_15467.p1  ORF type:complete len:233 (+),score=33.73 Phypoly_transcript_15467:196-894(+)
MHSPPARQDLSIMKNRLQVVMKDNFIPYWENLRKYVQSRLSKRELDQVARKLLGESNLYLHNIFIQAILSNARSAHLPEVIYKKPVPNPRVKTAGNIRGKVDKKPPQIRKRILPVTVPLLGPEYNVLCARLQKIAIESGLSGITQDAIQFMMLAIEVYIKQMCKNAKPLPRHSSGLTQALLPSSSSLSSSSSSLTLPSSLTLNDLYKTTILHPSLLGEDFLLHQERLSLSLM